LGLENTMRVLVTGVAGFIGFSLTQKLLAAAIRSSGSIA
jgi:nucleoside-diphosphate-sugar epimerase